MLPVFPGFPCLWAVMTHTFTGVVGVQCGRSPRFLNKPRTAGLTLVPTRVMLTAADEPQWIARISQITTVSVTVTYTASSN